MKAVADVYSNVVRLASREMTERHIFALLAYEDKPGTKEKFDRQFGPGAADRVLAEVRQPVMQPVVQQAPVPVQVTVQMEAQPPAPVTVNVPPAQYQESAAPQVVVQRVDDDRLAALEREIAEMRRPRKIRVTQRDMNGNILQLEQVME